jgi:hypothetical protein
MRVFVFVGGTGNKLYPTALQYANNLANNPDESAYIVCVDAKAELISSGIPLNDSRILTLFSERNDIESIFGTVNELTTRRAQVMQKAIRGISMTTEGGAAQMPYIMKSVANINLREWMVKTSNFFSKVFQKMEYTDVVMSIWGSAAGGTGNGGMTTIADMIYECLLPKNVGIWRDYFIITAESYLGVATDAGPQNGAALGLRIHRRVVSNTNPSNTQIYHFVSIPSSDAEDGFLRQQTLTNTFHMATSAYMESVHTISPNNQLSGTRGYSHVQANMPGIPYATIVASAAQVLAKRFLDLSNTKGTVTDIIFHPEVTTCSTAVAGRADVELLALPKSSPVRRVTALMYEGKAHQIDYFVKLSTTILPRRDIIGQLNSAIKALDEAIGVGKGDLQTLYTKAETLKQELMEIARRYQPTLLERLGMGFSQPDEDEEFERLSEALERWNTLVTSYLQVLERLAGMGEARLQLEARLKELTLQYQKAARILLELPEANGGLQVELTLADEVSEDSIINRLLYSEKDTAMIARILHSLVVGISFAEYCRLYGVEFDPVKFGAALAKADRTVGNSFGGFVISGNDDTKIYIGVPFDADMNAIEEGLRGGGLEAHLYRIQGTNIVALERTALRVEDFVPESYRKILRALYEQNHAMLYMTLLEKLTEDTVPSMPEIVSTPQIRVADEEALMRIMEE